MKTHTEAQTTAQEDRKWRRVATGFTEQSVCREGPGERSLGRLRHREQRGAGGADTKGLG